MARDFAKKVEAASRSDGGGEKSAILPVLGIIVIAGACFAAGFWLGGNQQKPVAGTASQSDLDSVRSDLDKKVSESALLQAEIESLQGEVDQWKRKAGAGAHTKLGELKFYKELPEQSVTPAPVADSRPAQARAMDRSLEVDAPKPVSADQPLASVEEAGDSASYRVQIASFKTRGEAAKLQLKLMKAGFTGFIHTVNLADRGQWFRVYAGPYPNKALAKGAVRDIQNKMKIRGMLVRDG